MTARVLVLLGVLGLAGPSTPAAQEPLATVAENARRALARGDLGAMLRGGDRILLQLPNAQPSAAIGVAQAEAALRALLARGEGQEVSVSGYREIERGRGYVELQRISRHREGAPVREQTILLGYRREGRSWVLVEVRVF